MSKAVTSYSRARLGLSKAQQSKKGTLSEDQLAEVKEAFALFDSEKSGHIDLRELKAALRALGIELAKDEIKHILTDLNKDLTSSQAITVSLDEFLRICSTRLSNRDSPEEFAKIFALFDEDGSGFITYRSLRKIVSELGEGLTDAEVQEMIDEADRDADGKVSLQEFIRVMKKRGDNPLDDWSSDED